MENIREPSNWPAIALYQLNFIQNNQKRKTRNKKPNQNKNNRFEYHYADYSDVNSNKSMKTDWLKV